ncbi:FK506-binding protein 59 [Gracilariopsis chorda]|uniref:peptidylprolyl isomerase n=1 Tax=Gracilariopsis chorda TaxID=448386 RepID=A0A2V3IHF5_9FLOR|nr:FK506-binding protein 59 [Gracilariopsis chorda]|eukprot:PXF41492.1 FK506-binding protein 59 [Gracilariopsis chorda]
MAAGPSAPSRQRKTLGNKKQAQAAEETKQESTQPDPAGKQEDSKTPISEKRVTRALGQRRERSAPPQIGKKTRADFIAEGIVDDVDDDLGGQLAPADIRFGIADVNDPFKLDEAEIAKQREEEESEKARRSVGQFVDVTGDGAVTKCVLQTGEGEIVPAGATVKVQYKGTLEDGSVFDDSSSRGGFEFVLGKGTVIKGWEAGVASMRKGEKAQFTIAPNYAYGRRGMPPVIPSNATLTFEIELESFSGGVGEVIKKVSDFNVDIARTPEDIAREYEEKLETQEERKKKRSLLDRFYIISPFASQTGEKPPWWIDPNITFFIVAAFVGIGFYFVWVSGAIHVGYVDQPIDVNIFK